MDKQTIGCRLRELRESRNLTQLELALLADVKTEVIENIEQARSWPRWPDICKLADALKVDLSELRIVPDNVERRKRGRPKPQAVIATV